MKSRINEAVSNDVTGNDVNMSETTVTPAALRPAAPRRESAGVWRTPGYTVIETALEVTAYSLTTR
ncbi:pyrroloquinoline quinone precursor peptide PqqA [Streptomyces sp. NPDC059008]|uniref:pyrroloquinoline quinone precursor peptide PqqA n=1 Tax=Streptomyces sp. NPDC059008 TaxID=3346693 RepID=UPI0036BF8803